jgi:hypothetical protein
VKELSSQSTGSAGQEKRMDHKIYSKPSHVEAEEGLVVIECADGLVIEMTPAAALETSERLFDKAVQAQGQRDWAKRQRAAAFV